MTTCPYCNTPLLAELTGHVICPRCGETVRTAAAEGTPTGPAEPSPPSATGRTNRQIALLVLVVMLIMAAIALIFALKTTAFRRAHDVKVDASPPAITSPIV